MDRFAAQTFGLSPEISDLVALLRMRAVTWGDKRAFTFLADGENERQHITYAQLDAHARAIATELQFLGLAGERALLLYPSGLEFIAAFFGCLYAGVVAAPAYPPRRNRNLARIESIVADAQPAIALSTKDVYERVAPMLAGFSALHPLPWLQTDAVSTSQGARWRQPDVDSSSLAFLQYTSGSTGTPKGVMLSHGNLLTNTSIIAVAMQPSHECTAVTWLPMYHDMGLIGCMVQPVFSGRPITIMSPTHFLQKPIRWLRVLSDTGARISGGPNFAYDLCAERVTEEEKRKLDLSQWEVAFNGAEPVRPDTIERFSQAFARCGFRREAFYPCYGLAEATLLVTGGEKHTAPTIRAFDGADLQRGVARQVDDPAADGVVRLVAAGKTMLDQEVAIVDPETLKECPTGAMGEIWVAGASVAQGYWGRPELSAQTFAARTAAGNGPYLRTGDLGFIDGGELFVGGRLKDLIIVRGVNHYPQDIELTVEQAHPDLRPACGAAFTVGELGAEKLVLAQEVGRRRDLPFDEIFAAIRRQVADLHEIAPQAIVLLKPNSIPKTSSGKIQRHACKSAYEANEFAAVATWNAAAGVKVLSRRGRGEQDADDSELAEHSETNGVATNGKLLRPQRSTLTIESAPTNYDHTSGFPETVDRVLKVVRNVAKERARELSLDTEIDAMGLDSLERMEIVAGLEDEFGGRFPEDAILEMNTCRDVVRAVETRLAIHLRRPGGEEQRVTRGDFIFAESAEYQRLLKTMEQAASTGLPNPYFTQHEGVTNDRTTIGGREYVNFCSYNYLGLSGDERVTRASQAALAQYGSSVSASRLVSGEKPLHRELELAIADFIGVDDSITFVGGHSTNETVIGHLFGQGDLILHDALSHNSIVQGCRLSGAHRRAFPHNDFGACEQLLERYRREYRRCLVVVEGVYSMDGDYSDVARLIELKKQHKSYLMVDEAHSLGTMGKTGHGMREFAGVAPHDVDLWMGTMSKSLGSCGGYIAGTSELVQYLKYTAPGFVYSVGLPPANAAAALESLRILEREPERVTQLNHNSRLFLQLARQAGLNTGLSSGTPIVPIIVGNSLLALKLSRALFDEGVNVQPIMYPAVEESAARLRFFLTATHTDEQIRHTVSLLATAWRRLTGAETLAAVR